MPYERLDHDVIESKVFVTEAAQRIVRVIFVDPRELCRNRFLGAVSNRILVVFFRSRVKTI